MDRVLVIMELDNLNMCSVDEIESLVCFAILDRDRSIAVEILHVHSLDVEEEKR